MENDLTELGFGASVWVFCIVMVLVFDMVLARRLRLGFLFVGWWDGAGVECTVWRGAPAGGTGGLYSGDDCCGNRLFLCGFLTCCAAGGTLLSYLAVNHYQ